MTRNGPAPAIGADDQSEFGFAEDRNHPLEVRRETTL
jgi:hypothetical protein